MLNWKTTLKSSLTAFALLFMSGSVFAADEVLTLAQVRIMIHGPDHLHPSADSLIGKYLKETGAATQTQQFWTAPEGSILPPRKRGPERLVVAVSPKTFPIFKKYFMTKHFLYLLNEHGNLAAFEGKMSNPREMWSGQVLDTDFTFLNDSNLGASQGIGLPRVAAPMILDSMEGQRARRYFKLAHLLPDAARFPWRLPSVEDPSHYYSGKGVWYDGCGTWIGNIPLGNKKVSQYYFPSGDDGESPIQQRLEKYTSGQEPNSKLDKLIHQVWQVPGHQQLGEILSPGANRRGEFDNAGWASYTFIGAAKAERIPIVFYFIQDATKPIPKNFKFAIDGSGAG